MATGKADDFTGRTVRGDERRDASTCSPPWHAKDYEDRRRRQMEGQAKAKVAGKYVGPCWRLSAAMGKIAAMLAAGTVPQVDVQTATGCSRATVSPRSA